MHFSLPMRIARRGVLVVLLCVFTAAPALASSSHPALWIAHDQDTTVFLFGTVHAMKKDAHWHFPALDKALKSSQVLYMEASDADPATLQPLVMQYGLDRDHPLSDKLDAQDKKRLAEAAKQLELPGGIATLNMMKPWLAGITIAAAPLLKAGYDPKLGVDKQIQAQFEAADKPVKGLESAKQQIMFMVNLPEATQLKLLRKNLRDYAHAREQLTSIIAHWSHGDVDALAHTIVTKLRDQAPDLYQVLIVQRNQNWSKQIAELMHNTPGTIFIAVGSGHLAGPDRLQVQLRKHGIETTRITE